MKNNNSFNKDIISLFKMISITLILIALIFLFEI